MADIKCTSALNNGTTVCPNGTTSITTPSSAFSTPSLPITYTNLTLEMLDFLTTAISPIDNNNNNNDNSNNNLHHHYDKDYYNITNTDIYDNFSSFSTPIPGRPRGGGGGSLPVGMQLQIPVYILIFLLSVVGNVLVMVTLIQNKKMRTVTNVFLLNLAVSDLLLAVFCMPFTIIPLVLKNFVFGAAMCVMIRYF